ncbi:MAG: alkyl sulfatase dimerization domain-containing protein [Chloroflexota bacterium]
MGNEEEKTAVFPTTITYNKAVAKRLPLDDQQAFADAKRGWLASFPEGGVKRADGSTAWDRRWFDFQNAPCPASVNPSLWRHAQLNNIDGLFEVCDGVWQARACDYANMTIIRGDTGWILVDPLVARETAAAALALVNKTLGKRPVSAVLVTHCHPDHFAGIRGVVGDDPDKFPPIYVPENFTEAAAAEGIMAGTAMFRRSMFQFGVGLPFGPTAKVDGGIGKMPAQGTRTFAAPSEFIRETGETCTIDGVTFEFQMASGTEAPAEFTFLLPDHKLLCMAEVCTQTMHNLLPPRGAKVRDALLWANVIDEALVLFAERADVLINSHNWPVWGQAAVKEYLAEQRDIYKYTHDQTLRLANLGYTPNEIAAALEEPEWLSHRFHARGYYGSLSFNSRATYQRYLGFYDGRPVNLNPLPPTELGAHYVAVLGGVDKIIDLARSAIENDELQWASTLLNHVIFADGTTGVVATDEAKSLLADVYRNQGFRCESGIMRNVYLKGAHELENGVRPLASFGAGRNKDLAAALSLADWFNIIAVRLNPERARGVQLAIRFHVGQRVARIEINRQTETVRTGRAANAGEVEATVHLTLEQLEMLSNNALDLNSAEARGVQIEGNHDVVQQWIELHDSFDLWFNIVTP